MTGDSETVLSAEGLVKEYPGPPCRRALDCVTLDIPRGTFVALMGPSGSGKSTLLHLLGALDTPSAGTVHFEGRCVGDLSDDARTRLRRDRIGFVFQAFHLVDMLTVAENVSLGAAIRGTCSPGPTPLMRGTGPSRSSPTSVCRDGGTTIRTDCRAASSSESRSPGPCLRSPPLSSRTNQPATSTNQAVTLSWECSAKPSTPEGVLP